MSIQPPVTMGIVGMGGYGSSIARLLLNQSRKESPVVRLVSVCDPDQATHAKAAEELRAQGVSVHDSLAALLTEPCEAVWLPVPIDLHRSFTEQALAAGKSVMCEKPAAGCVDDVDAMIAARDRAGLPVGIGFQDTHADSTALIKRRLLNGDIGRITHATVYACWARDDHYYARAGWAGAMKRNGVWVLDSPANNAISHFIMLPMFLLGPEMGVSAIPVAIEAELYRARPTIESFDTLSMKVQLDTGVSLLVLMTHACASNVGPIITLHGDRGTLTRTQNELTLTTRDGQTAAFEVGDRHADMVRRFAEAVRGQPDPDRPLVSLEIARQQLVCVNAAMQCAPILSAPATHADHGPYVIADINDAFARCADRNVMLHESGLLPWTRPARGMDVRGYARFTGPYDDDAAR